MTAPPIPSPSAPTNVTACQGARSSSAPRGAVEAHFVRHDWNARGAVLLRDALSAYDLAVWLGTLYHGPSAPLPDTADLRTWLPDACASACALDEAIDSAFYPAATARANLLIRLAQGVLLREDAADGRLRPFLPSGPRVQLLDLRRPNRHVAVFRKRAGRGVVPPDLAAIAGRARHRLLSRRRRPRRTPRQHRCPDSGRTLRPCRPRPPPRSPCRLRRPWP